MELGGWGAGGGQQWFPAGDDPGLELEGFQESKECKHPLRSLALQKFSDSRVQ